MSISLLHRYYLQKLVRQKMTLNINIQGANISLNLAQVSPNLSFNDLESREKYIRLELLISMHQKLATNGTIYADKLSQIEKDIFAILQLKMEANAYLSWLNRLSDLAKKYLGTNMVVKYWKSSQDKLDLELFEVSNSGEITFTGSTNDFITEQQQEKIQLWIEKFIAHCSIIIRGFEETIVAEILIK